MSTTDLPDDLIDARQAARLAKTHIATIHRWRLAGRIRSWRRGRQWFFCRAEILGQFRRFEPPSALQVAPTQTRNWVEAELHRHKMR